MDRKNFRMYLLCACCTVAFYFFLREFGTILGWLDRLLLVLRPVMVGGVLAFVLNIPLRRLLPLFRRGGLARRPGAAHALAVAATYLLAFGVVAGIILFIVPQLADSVRMLAGNLEAYSRKAIAMANQLAQIIDPELWQRLDIPGKLSSLYERLPSILEAVAGGVVGTVGSLVGGVKDTLLGFIFSIYLLLDKEHLKSQCKRVLRAFLPRKVSREALRLFGMIEQTFSAFIGGQCTEAVILGVLCFVGMSIFGFAYAPLISVIIGITNLIPILGPILGTVPCALLLLFVDPIKALWFVVFIILLQQLESNLIYPRVVGSSVGLPALWVLLAVTVGGGLGGVAGMVIGIPACSIVRRLIKEAMVRRENAREQASAE